MTSIIERASGIIDSEIEALQKLKEGIGEGFVQTIDLILKIHGKVIVTGVGKSGLIGRKMAATLSSLGTPAFFLHPDDAMHGDLGMLTNNDAVIAISNSGESEELLHIIPNIKIINAPIIAITNDISSHLATMSDIICPIPKVVEAGILGLAPTSSTTTTIALGDAIAVVLSEIRMFDADNFAVFHPAGILGKRLTTRVGDIMHCGTEIPVISKGSILKDALFIISAKGFGSVMVTDQANKLLGLVTDGDIRRAMEKTIDINETSVEEIMTKAPVTIHKDILAAEVMVLMQEGGKRLSSLPVIDDDGTVIGIVTITDIMRLGLIY